MAFMIILGLVSLFLQSANGTPEFRGAFITYRIENENLQTYDLRIIYQGAFKGTPNDCSPTTSTAASIRVTSFASTAATIQCGAANSQGVFIGGGERVIRNVPKGIEREIDYGMDSSWFTPACCTNMISFNGDFSIDVLTKVPQLNPGTLNSMNEPPVPTNLLNIVITAGTSQTYQIAVTDKENNVIRCNKNLIFPRGGALIQTASNADLVQTGSGCIVMIDATSKAPGEYPFGFNIEDFVSSTSTIPLHTIPYQFVFTVVSAAPTNAINAQVDCTQNNMRVTIAASEFTTGNAPAANQITFANQVTSQCQSTFNGQVYTLQSDLSNCGTTYTGIETSTDINPAQTYLVYANTVVVGRSGNGLITRDLSASIGVKCKYVRDYTSENDKSYTATSLVSSEEENLGQFTIQLRAFDSTFANVQLSMSVSLRDRQYCQIDVTDNNFDTVVIVSRIFASNSATRGVVDEKIHDLFINRCPNPADSTVIMSNQQSTRSQFRFSFEAFMFTSTAAGSQVYVHCDTFICHEDSIDALCNQACTGYNNQPNTNNVGRAALAPGGKKRRAIEKEIESIEGKELIDLNAPSRTYFLVVGPYTRDDNKASGKRDNKKSNYFWNKENFVVLASLLLVLCIALSAVFYAKYQKMKIMNNALSAKPSLDMDIKSAFECNA